MDVISGLSDDLLVKILSILPTKDAVSTCILSKRWDCLWMSLPKLDYSEVLCSTAEAESLRRFLNRTLPLHRASVLESLRLDFGHFDCKHEEVRLWIASAVSRCVRELDISFNAVRAKQMEDVLPSSFYVCKSLTVLKLEGDILLDVPRMASLPFLKTLQLATGLDGETLRLFLSNCPVLENLMVFFPKGDNKGKIIVVVPSLRRLSLNIHCDVDGFEIDTPSLEYLKFHVPFQKYPDMGTKLPSSLYACKSLAVLKLRGDIVLNVPCKAVFSSLKTLKLEELTSVDGESLRRFLSVCPLLENLSVIFCDDEDIGTVIVTAPNLQSLSLDIPLECCRDGLEIDTPSLTYLKLADHNYANGSRSCLIKNMSKLVKAYVNASFADLTSTPQYGSSFVFNQLEHLELCACLPSWSKLLARFLKESPNLQVLDIFLTTDHEQFGIGRFIRPRSVPKCLMSSLHTLNWSGYMGSREEREIAVYILKNARSLRTAKISSSFNCYKPKLEILKELSIVSRASASCELVLE